MTTESKKLDDLEIFQKRMEILSGARLRETDTIKDSTAIQDKIRNKVGKWHGSSEIRKWRKRR